MFKIELEDFLEEIKAELFSYDELSEEDILAWEEKFLSLFNDGKLNSLKTSITPIKEISLEDETDIFQIADGFIVAMMNDEVAEYWESL